MILSARALVASAFTTTAINAQIAALNTLFSTAAADCQVVQDGWLASPADAGAFPSLTYIVGGAGNPSEMKRFGKRDTLVDLRCIYVSRAMALDDSIDDVLVAMEGMPAILETLTGLQHGSTKRYIVDVRDPRIEIQPMSIGGEPVRHGGELRCSLYMRTEGL